LCWASADTGTSPPFIVVVSCKLLVVWTGSIQNILKSKVWKFSKSLAQTYGAHEDWANAFLCWGVGGECLLVCENLDKNWIKHVFVQCTTPIHNWIRTSFPYGWCTGGSAVSCNDLISRHCFKWEKCPHAKADQYDQWNAPTMLACLTRSLCQVNAMTP
jgi:hypothetical protein